MPPVLGTSLRLPGLRVSLARLARKCLSFARTCVPGMRCCWCVGGPTEVKPMIRNSHPATLAATAIVSLAIGFGFATLLPSQAVPIEPIIDANAWNEPAPQSVNAHPVSMRASLGASERCSPWEVSDVAMEEVLDEMIRRGWHPPRQGDAVEAMDTAQTIGLSATDPDAPMPYRRSGLLSDLLVRDEGDQPEEPTDNSPPSDPSAPSTTSEQPVTPPT